MSSSKRRNFVYFDNGTPECNVHSGWNQRKPDARVVTEMGVGLLEIIKENRVQTRCLF